MSIFHVGIPIFNLKESFSFLGIINLTDLTKPNPNTETVEVAMNERARTDIIA